MARLFTAGAELQDAMSEGADHAAGTGTASYDATVVRSGTRSFKYDSAAGNLLIEHDWRFTGVLGRTYYLRVFMRKPANPSAIAQIIQFSDSTGANTILAVRLTTTGTLQLWNHVAAAQIGSDSAALNNDQWYMLEVGYKVGTGSTDYAELRIDGVQVAVSTNFSITDSPPLDCWFGWVTAPGANKVIYFDDFALNDDQGAAQNSWPGDGHVIVLPAASDNTITNWTAGAGATTSLFDAVNNVPPAGLASASETNTSNVESANASGTASYTANIQTYSAAGLVAGDTINAVSVVAVHGEDIATGTKAGTIELTSNPVIASVAFNFGTDGGAHGAWPGLWRGTQKSASAPSLTLGSAPVAKIVKTDTGTRVACACFMGVLVDYVPAVPKAPPPFSRPHRFFRRVA